MSASSVTVTPETSIEMLLHPRSGEILVEPQSRNGSTSNSYLMTTETNTKSFKYMLELIAKANAQNDCTVTGFNSYLAYKQNISTSMDSTKKPNIVSKPKNIHNLPTPARKPKSKNRQTQNRTMMKRKPRPTVPIYARHQMKQQASKQKDSKVNVSIDKQQKRIQHTSLVSREACARLYESAVKQKKQMEEMISAHVQQQIEEMKKLRAMKIPTNPKFHYVQSRVKLQLRRGKATCSRTCEESDERMDSKFATLTSPMNVPKAVQVRKVESFIKKPPHRGVKAFQFLYDTCKEKQEDGKERREAIEEAIRRKREIPNWIEMPKLPISETDAVYNRHRKLYLQCEARKAKLAELFGVEYMPKMSHF
ncbi:predicted protein [Chaetoceros tenuissimus]|uniref:Uncharacterized protein n=1 Tax=Chaetoceros tenuissimus TaxID=426638 RepID=A0AAD3CM93_9STRA|nr:predicted protein [Chaetoceros tenuissimus]